MSLKAKIEAVIYASEEPVTLAQLMGLLGQEAQAELDHLDSAQQTLALDPEAASASPAEPSDEPKPDSQSETAEAEATEPEPTDPPPSSEPEPEESSPIPERPPIETTSVPATEVAHAEEAVPAAQSATPEPKADTKQDEKAREKRLREYFRAILDQLIADYATESNDRGLEIREVASGFRLSTKPQYHDAVRGFVKSLKPPLKLSLQALETLAVVAYKQPVTAPEVSEIRGVDSGGVLGSLMTRKLVTTAGRKQVIGRPILYKTTRDFLLRFGLKDINELPSIEEFEKMAGELADAFAEPVQEEIPMPEHAAPEAAKTDTGVTEAEATETAEAASEVEAEKDVVEPQSDGDETPLDPPAEDPVLTEAIDESHSSTLRAGQDEPAGSVADEVLTDGRISGLPPSYDDETAIGSSEGVDSPALDAEIQSEAQADVDSESEVESEERHVEEAYSGEEGR